MDKDWIEHSDSDIWRKFTGSDDSNSHVFVTSCNMFHADVVLFLSKTRGAFTAILFGTSNGLPVVIYRCGLLSAIKAGVYRVELHPRLRVSCENGRILKTSSRVSDSAYLSSLCFA